MSLLFKTLLGLLKLFCQEVNVFWFHGCSHHPHWFYSPRRGNLLLLPSFSPLFAEVMGQDALILLLVFSFKPALSLSSFKRLFSSSSLSAIRVVLSAYLRWLMLLLRILIPACNPSSLVFLMMCAVYRLDKQGDRRQPCHTLFSILNLSVTLNNQIYV